MFRLKSYNDESNFDPLKVVGRGRDPQLQAGSNLSSVISPRACWDRIFFIFAQYQKEVT